MSYRTRPGAGFVLLCVGAASTATFFGWGLMTPRLDRVWRLQIELEVGERKPLSGEEFGLLQKALVDYPGLSQAMQDAESSALVSAHRGELVDAGYGYLVRQRASPAEVEVVAGGAATAAVPVQVMTTTGRGGGDATAPAPFRWRLPDDGPFPQLMEVRFGKKAAGGTRGRGAVSIRMREIAP